VVLAQFRELDVALHSAQDLTAEIGTESAAVPPAEVMVLDPVQKRS
jgi:hypothetical protein